MTRLFSVPEDTARHQRQAADPGWSAWVAANAGSGKTHVLTQRVLRLLLAGAEPESVLCLTYTKAAAAEMRGRVSQALGRWAMMENAPLDDALRGLGLTPGPKLRQTARTLFARALETPGGLKIVTIHAFCESVLHRFPLEAGVPFDFKVIEDVEREAMVLAAREAVLAEGLRGEGDVPEAVETLFDLMTDFAIAAAIDTALAETRKLRPVLADIPAAKTNLRQLVDYRGRDGEAIAAEILDNRLIGPAEQAAILAAVPQAKNGFEAAFATVDHESANDSEWMAPFFTQKGERRANIASRLAKVDPTLAALVEAEEERLVALAAERTCAQLVARSEALLDILGAIAGRYESSKRARSLLDFDDLVERLGDLFADRSLGPWVQYKLDAGIHHILVDESQDTNPEQWRVVTEIADEFFSGEGQISRPRTLFAVGDPKQSIYSFQGAEPALFLDAGRRFERSAVAAKRPFAALPLRTSFRTLRGIIEAVDKVCARSDIQAALLEAERVHHDTARTEPGGTVTLWPPEHRPKTAAPNGDWPLEPPEDPEQSAPRAVANRIAREIANWIAAGRTLANGKPVTADDVLVLVQSRSPLFHEIIGALNRRGLATPGADRLWVTRHIAVMDLLALADILANPADDLQLAAVLRSPLFDVSEDDLFEIAHDRGRKPLWQALAQTRIATGITAWRTLHRWRGRLDFDRPFEFFSHVLYAEGGLKRFHQRLGGEVDDVLAEFLELALAHEQERQPSLAGFVAAMRHRDVSIKRDLAERGGGVRVMTVHGAKGLEAPIVILADAASKPAGSVTNKPVYIRTDPPLLIHASGGADHTPETLDIREKAQANLTQEYWRKLYVGMTRAEEALYVTGALTPGMKYDSQVAGTWYEALLEALGDESVDASSPDSSDGGAIGARHANANRPYEPLSLPPLPEPLSRPFIRPSSAFEGRAEPLETAAESARDAEEARKSGIALHALLQHLSRLPAENRPAVAARALPVLIPDHAHLHSGLIEKTISILSRPDFAHLFTPESRAEIPFLLEAHRSGKPIRLAGRIDRLVVDETSVLVVDYKSDATLPASPDAVPGNYLTQLGLYALVAGQLFPDRTVQAAILWTSLESLMNLDRERLAAAVEDFTLE